MTSIESLSDTEMLEEQQQSEVQQNGTDRAQKRTREDSEGEWTTVGHRKDKKMKDTEKIELYISCANEPLPKQFALANIFKKQNIVDIINVKYLNPFKVRVDLISEISAEKLETCQEFKNKNWRIQKAFERSVSYGVIKDVDLELSNESILDNISCLKPAQIISAHRLNRRKSNEPGWIPSETVRLCFKGTFIPAYVYVHDMRVRVEKYEFPVTQCSQCWKFGHRKIRCSYKIVCPKCGKNHENCENTSYKCVNCSGKHMAFARVCPSFMKEKKVRLLMSEFNCTYRKALELYVPPEFTDQEEERKEEREDIIINEEEEPQQNYPSTSKVHNNPTDKRNIPTYAETIKNKYFGMPKKPCKPQTTNTETEFEDWNTEDTHNDKTNSSSRNSREKDFHIGELLRRLKEIIFLRGITIQSKFVATLKCCIEWSIITFVNNLSDWPILKFLLDYLQDEDGQRRE